MRKLWLAALPTLCLAAAPAVAATVGISASPNPARVGTRCVTA